MLDKAIYIASLAHLGQFDKGGNPYILHPLAVMYGVSGEDEEVQCIAVLHDVPEDSEYWTLEKLKEEGFSSRVIDGLRLMTHTKDVDYFDYIEGMKHNLDALKVKKQDLEQNSKTSRMKGLRQKDFDRLIKYNKAYAMVEMFIKNFESIETFKKENL